MASIDKVAHVPGRNGTTNNYVTQSPNPMLVNNNNSQNEIVSGCNAYELVQTPQGIVEKPIQADRFTDAKEKLMQNFKKIRTTNYAVEFCIFLIEAQKMPEEYKGKTGIWRYWKDQPVNVCKSLLEIVKKEPDEIVKIICEAISAPKEEIERHLNVLDLSESEGEERQTEYLNQLIKTVESLVKLHAPPNLYTFAFDLKVEDYEKPIVALKEYLIADGRYITEKAFGGMFHLGLKRFVVSPEEKKGIVDMMVEAMPHITTFIKGYCYDFNYTLGIVRLQIRSSLQFIRDLLAQYPAERENLRKLIGSLDEVIETVDKRSECLFEDIIDTSGMNEEECCVEFLDETLANYYNAGARDVPKEHIWWQRYKGNFF